MDDLHYRSHSLNVNWDDLRIFLAVARAGTLSTAGRRLALDPTTVARRLGRLEAEIGRSLFEITPGGHVLTPRGQELMSHAQAMESAAIACAEGASSGVQPGGTIRVSVSEGFGTWIVAPHLRSFAEAHPGTAVELVASTGFLNPSRREADIAIMLARPKQGPLIARKLTDYRLGLYGVSGTHLADDEPLTAQRLIGYVPDLIYAPELHYLEEAAPGLSATLASTSVNAQAAMVRSGAGIGILPCFIGDADPGMARLLALSIDIRRTFWLVVHRDLRGVARVKLFIDWLDALIARMRPALDGTR
jgi:DNA-binding transcriptional LysR family regulator